MSFQISHPFPLSRTVSVERDIIERLQRNLHMKFISHEFERFMHEIIFSKEYIFFISGKKSKRMYNPIVWVLEWG